jgi:hypothetical protein
MPLRQAEAALEERLRIGNDLKDRSISDKAAYEPWSAEISTWHDWNRTWLDRYIGPTVRQEYAHVGPRVYSAYATFQDDYLDRLRDLSTSLRRLGSIRDRLSLWTDDQEEETAVLSSVDPNGPIFVVHGHDEAALSTAVRVLDRATDRDVVVLRDEPNSGRTLIEKFEHHAAAAAFAVVLVTGDDVGGPKAAAREDLQGRARQNVVFELGFFFGKLGRERVVVLLQEGVEQPSDIAGLVYYPIDPGGAWKTALCRELDAAGVKVDFKRIP